jgi:hypothetical protein
MNKLIILLVLTMATTTCFAQVADPSHPMIQKPDGTLVSDTNPQATTATIGAVTVDAFPVYKNPTTGDPETSALDSETRVVVNLAADSLGLTDTIGDASLSPTTLSVAKLSLLASTSTAIADPWAGSATLKQEYIEIKSANDTDVFWISFGSGAVIEGNARPCKGRVYIEMREQLVYVISADAVDFYVTHGAVAR